jgi:hypothetical protein
MNYSGFHYKIFYPKRSTSKFDLLRKKKTEVYRCFSTASPLICSIENENPVTPAMEIPEQQPKLTIMSKLHNKYSSRNKSNERLGDKLFPVT